MADETAQVEITGKLDQLLKDLGLLEQHLQQVEDAAKRVGLASTEKARERLANLTRTAAQARTSINELRDAGKALGLAYDRLKVPVAAAGVAIAAAAREFAQFTAAAVKSKVAFDAIEQTIKAVTDTTEDYSRAQALVLDTARRLGLSIQGLGQDYANFLASTKPLALSQKEIEDAFVAVSEAGRVLNLSQQRLNLTFLALSQIASKGIATMEELRRQLGDQLPGVFPRVAAALGVTTSQLIEMIRNGEVLAEEVIPAITQAARDLAGGQVLESTKNLAAVVARLKLEYELFLKAVAEGGENELKAAAEAARQLVLANGDLATTLGQLSGALAQAGVFAADQLSGIVENVLRVRDAIGGLLASIAQFTAPKDLLAFLALVNKLGDALTFVIAGAQDTRVAFDETWASVQDGAKDSGKSLEELAREAGRTGEAAARAAGKVEESGQRVAQSIAESIRLIASARERAAAEMAEAGNDAFAEFEAAVGGLVEAAKEAFGEQTEARRDAVAEQIEIEREATQRIISEFEARAEAFEVEESKRAEVTQDVAEKLLDVEREIAEKRQKILAEALEAGEKASAEEREKILEEAQEKILELEEKLTEKRRQIVEKGIDRLVELEKKRTEEVKKELEKIAEEEEKLAKKREKLLQDSLKATGEFFRERVEGLGFGEVGVDGGSAQEQLQELIRQRDELRKGFIGGSPEELNEFNAKITELNEKILLARSGVSAFGETAGQAAQQADFDFKTFSDGAVTDLLDLIGGEAFKTAFGNLATDEQAFTKSAIANFLDLGQNAALTESSVRELAQVFLDFGLTAPGKVRDVTAALDELGQPSEVDQKLGELAAKAKELGAAAEVAVGPLQEIDTAVGGIAASGEEAGAAAAAIGAGFAENQGAITAAGEALSQVSDATPALASDLDVIAKKLPELLEAVKDANDEETIKSLAADIQELATQVAAAKEGFEPVVAGIKEILEAADKRAEVTALKDALVELSKTSEALGKVATSLSDIARELGDVVTKGGQLDGALRRAQEALSAFKAFIDDEATAAVGRLNEALGTIITKLGEVEKAFFDLRITATETFEGIVSGAAQAGAAVERLRGQIQGAKDDAADAFDADLGPATSPAPAAPAGGGAPLAGAVGPVQPGSQAGQPPPPPP